MRATRVWLFAIMVLGLAAGAAFAQEMMTGQIATIDEAAGKVGIRLTGTVGLGDSTAPTQFKVQDGLLLSTVKAGDKVSFTTETVNGVMTIKTLTKE